MTTAAVVFAACLILLAYVYVGYPLVCALLAAVMRRGVAAAGLTPPVSILIAARNEARDLPATLRNKLELDYPADLVEIIVVSDASEDGTDRIVREMAAEHPGRVKLLRQDERGGKTLALNRAAAAASGEILVFSDANSLYHRSALRALAAAMADPEVGYVTGSMAYRAPDGSLSGRGCSAYMRYENMLRGLETRIGSVVGVDGGIDAVRAELYRPMRADQLPDFVLPLTVVAAGRRVVYTPEAVLYEDALAEAGDEFRMRVRVALRALHALRDMSGLLDPLRHGLFSWQLFSHKLLRYLAPVFMAGALASNAVLASAGGAWAGLLAAQVVFYASAAAGHALRSGGLPVWLGLPYYFCLVNSAAGVALLRFLRGDRMAVWTPRT